MKIENNVLIEVVNSDIENGVFEIPNSVQKIGDSVFRNCSSLNSIEIPNSVQKIGYSAFYNCSNLKSVEIPNSVRRIGYSAFYNCSNLKSVEIPNSVRRIGDCVFSNCSNLKSVEIPNSVRRIGDCVFSNCSNLKSVTFKNEKLRTECVDGYLMEVLSEKSKNEFRILKTRFFPDGKLGFVVEKNGIFSHGETVKQAISDFQYKISDRDCSEFKNWKLEDEKSREELIQAYRKITGACSEGTKYFCEHADLPRKCTIKEAIEIVKGQWNSEKFEEFFV